MWKLVRSGPGPARLAAGRGGFCALSAPGRWPDGGLVSARARRGRGDRVPPGAGRTAASCLRVLAGGPASPGPGPALPDCPTQPRLARAVDLPLSSCCLLLGRKCSRGKVGGPCGGQTEGSPPAPSPGTSSTSGVNPTGQGAGRAGERDRDRLSESWRLGRGRQGARGQRQRRRRGVPGEETPRRPQGAVLRQTSWAGGQRWVRDRACSCA